MSTVSLLTITQFSRFALLENLYDIIKRQIYSNIKEWIIVEGSQSTENREKNNTQIQNFIIETQESTDIILRFIIPNDIIALSNLRNVGNDNCTGNIIVCMDDDDYYHEEYISQCVIKLTKYNRLIVGCSATYFYDFHSKKLYKFKGFHNNHTTNNCMAYRREYLESHRYKEGLLYAEEYDFTNGFTEPMIQINPEKSIIVSCHKFNTVDKYYFIYKNAVELGDGIMDMIPKDIFERMEKIFSEYSNK
jgi:glycosyltransferase involved in cell wall biosynthesis